MWGRQTCPSRESSNLEITDRRALRVRGVHVIVISQNPGASEVRWGSGAQHSATLNSEEEKPLGRKVPREKRLSLFSENITDSEFWNIALAMSWGSSCMKKLRNSLHWEARGTIAQVLAHTFIWTQSQESPPTNLPVIVLWPTGEERPCTHE